MNQVIHFEESADASPQKENEDTNPNVITDFTYTETSQPIVIAGKDFAFHMEWEDPIQERPISFSCLEHFNKEKHTVSTFQIALFPKMLPRVLTSITS